MNPACGGKRDEGEKIEVPTSKHHSLDRFSLSGKDERADAARDGRDCLARPNSLARTGTHGKKCTGTERKNAFPVELTSSRIRNHDQSVAK